jgi:hypothetical protein
MCFRVLLGCFWIFLWLNECENGGRKQGMARRRRRVVFEFEINDASDRFCFWRWIDCDGIRVCKRIEWAGRE